LYINWGPFDVHIQYWFCSRSWILAYKKVWNKGEPTKINLVTEWIYINQNMAKGYQAGHHIWWKSGKRKYEVGPAIGRLVLVCQMQAVHMITVGIFIFLSLFFFFAKLLFNSATDQIAILSNYRTARNKSFHTATEPVIDIHVSSGV
jgi:hypothetical protein